nr:hypothetical protein [Microbacterium ginsengisoli]
MQQHAGRRLVDGLSRRHQGHARIGQGAVDLDVILAVASQTVDLVDDDVVHIVLADVLQHPLQLGPVGRAC